MEAVGIISLAVYKIREKYRSPWIHRFERHESPDRSFPLILQEDFQKTGVYLFLRGYQDLFPLLLSFFFRVYRDWMTKTIIFDLRDI